MPRRRRLLVAGLLVLAVLAGGLTWGWWYMSNGRYPLAGDLRHDFGEVDIAGVTASFEHTFELRNRRSEPVVIQRIQPSCGCTTIKSNPRTVPPGETIDIDIALHLNKAGRKTSKIDLLIEDFGVQTLWVRAVGRKETAITINQVNLPLTKGRPNPLLVFAEIQSSDDRPAPPTFVAPEGVTVQFLSWEPVRKRNRRTGVAARWRGRLMVELEAETLPPAAQLEVMLGETGPAVVPLTSIPVPVEVPESAAPNADGA